MIVFTPMNIYNNHIEKYKEPKKLIINVNQIDQSIKNIILMRKLKRINYKQCCLKLKSLYNKRKRQIRRQINFFNKYTLKYDYYYPLINMDNYIDVFYKCRKSTAWKRTYQNFNINIIKNISYIWYNMMNNTMNFLEIFNLYKAWRKNILKQFNSYNLISRNDEYFKYLFNLKYANFKNKIYIFR